MRDPDKSFCPEVIFEQIENFMQRKKVFDNSEEKHKCLGKYWSAVQFMLFYNQIDARKNPVAVTGLCKFHFRSFRFWLFWKVLIFIVCRKFPMPTAVFLFHKNSNGKLRSIFSWKLLLEFVESWLYLSANFFSTEPEKTSLLVKFVHLFFFLRTERLAHVKTSVLTEESRTL